MKSIRDQKVEVVYQKLRKEVTSYSPATLDLVAQTCVDTLDAFNSRNGIKDENRELKRENERLRNTIHQLQRALRHE